MYTVAETEIFAADAKAVRGNIPAHLLKAIKAIKEEIDHD